MTITSFHAKKNGFTLVELLVVATIIIVLMSIAITSYRSASLYSRDAKRKADMETLRQSMVLYKAEQGCYPNQGSCATPGAASTLTEAGAALSADNYLSGPTPIDPINKTVNSKLYVYGGSSSPTQFCFCALLEVARGNAKATDCANANWVNDGTGSHYCVKNP